MTLLPRKLTFQLTPLLDLLLIVIFAQYMEVQNATQQSEVDSSNRITAAERQLQAAADSLEALRAGHLLDQEALKRSEQQNDDLGQQNNKLQREYGKELTELKEELRLAMQQRDLVGELVVELFQIPDETVEQALKPRTSTETVRTREEIEKLRETFRAMAKKHDREMVKHLLTHEELRKRCDIWDIYINQQGVIFWDTGRHTHEFRARTSSQFEQEVFKLYKTLPQPKSLVIMLLSWGYAKKEVRQAVEKGLPGLASRMREDSNQEIRFEYAILGYISHERRADPP